MAIVLATRPERTESGHLKALDARADALEENCEQFPVLPDCDAGMRLLNILARIERRRHQRRSQ
jgi:hypothetical protein